MPKKLLQMNQLLKFYNLITGNGVKIRATSKSDNYMSFKVKGSYEGAVESFSIIYTDDNGGLSAVKNYRDMISLGSYGWVKRKDGSYRKQSTDLCSFKLGSEGYKLLTDLFNNIKKLNFSTYDGKEFCRETFSPFIEAMRDLNSQRTTEGSSTTTELSNFSKWEESTTKGVEHRVQKDDKYVAAALKQQEFDLAPDETTEEINRVIQKMIESNTMNGITTENIEYVKNMTNVLGNTPKGVLERTIFNGTSVEEPKLPEITGPSGARVLAAGVAGGVLGVLGFLGVAVVYWLWRGKSRKDSYDVEKAGVENKVEA